MKKSQLAKCIDTLVLFIFLVIIFRSFYFSRGVTPYVSIVCGINMSLCVFILFFSLQKQGRLPLGKKEKKKRLDAARRLLFSMEEEKALVLLMRSLRKQFPFTFDETQPEQKIVLCKENDQLFYAAFLRLFPDETLSYAHLKPFMGKDRPLLLLTCGKTKGLSAPRGIRFLDKKEEETLYLSLSLPKEGKQRKIKPLLLFSRDKMHGYFRAGLFLLFLYFCGLSRLFACTGLLLYLMGLVSHRQKKSARLLFPKETLQKQV